MQYLVPRVKKRNDQAPPEEKGMVDVGEMMGLKKPGWDDMPI